MLASFDKAGKAAVDAKQLKDVRSFTTAENQATEQAAQIHNLILDRRGRPDDCLRAWRPADLAVGA